MKRAFLISSVLALGGCASAPVASQPAPAASQTESARCVPKTFASDASPIFRTRCTPCHMPGGEAADEHDFSRAENARAQRRLIFGKVSTHTMPPPGAGTLRQEEEATILAWAMCGD